MTAATPALLAGLCGLLVGLLVQRELAPAGYRVEPETQRPLPRHGWLVAPSVALVWALLTARFGLTPGLAPLLLVGVVGVALTRIDLDVHRLPEGLTLPALVAVVALQLVASALTGDWAALLQGLLAGLLSWLVYLLLVLLSRGALGWGDATLGALTGLTLGYLEPTWAALAVAAAFLLGGLVSALGLATRRLTLATSVAFGPYILLGALLVALVAPT